MADFRRYFWSGTKRSKSLGGEDRGCQVCPDAESRRPSSGEADGAAHDSKMWTTVEWIPLLGSSFDSLGETSWPQFDFFALPYTWALSRFPTHVFAGHYFILQGEWRRTGACSPGARIAATEYKQTGIVGVNKSTMLICSNDSLSLHTISCPLISLLLHAVCCFCRHADWLSFPILLPL